MKKSDKQVCLANEEPEGDDLASQQVRAIAALFEMLNKLADGCIVTAPCLPHPIAMSESGSVGYFYDTKRILGNFTVREALDIANQIKNDPDAHYIKMSEKTTLKENEK